MRTKIDELGYAIIDGALGPEEVDAIVQASESIVVEAPAAGRGGVRDILRRLPSICRVLRFSRVVDVVHDVLGPGAFATRGILFDKNASSNWKVPWHQDLSIAVRAQAAAEGYSSWSTKAGIVHVQPPAAVLERMLAVRIHLEDCGLTSGPVRVLPGTDLLGRLSSEGIATARDRVPEVSCHVARGGLLVMRPLLLHASSPATTVGRRRVLHIEFAASELAPGLEWFEQWWYAA
jgi:ectoine hydroxylase-related dioxygenase (phytanoyl-CoA dioxygenase family)